MENEFKMDGSQFKIAERSRKDGKVNLQTHFLES